MDQSPPPDLATPKTSSNNRAKSLYLLGVILLLATFLGGYLSGQASFKTTPVAPTKVQKNILDNPIFQNISTSITGTISANKNNTLSITSSTGSADFPISSQFRLFLANSNKVASGSAAISAIETGKQALIILNYNRQTHQFEITNLNYSVGTPPTASSSAKAQPK